MKKKIFLGRYLMFDAPILVYADPGETSATGVFGKHHGVEVTLPLNHDCWSKVYRYALHEMVEVAFVLARLSYVPASTLHTNYHAADQYQFHMTHREFTVAMDHAGDAMAYLGPELFAAWKKTGAKK